ncbi:LysR family transcriptional regulator [Aquabacter sp. CN5-332]|uniref:LysR family transcriptional regulator n=1 Tax=Aquabacter sp. CN5-332 TaxID=3156608 RepID=UPI0032B58688
MFVRQLHYLVAVAREAHFGRAADACHVSQPTLSSGIRKLEEELGLPLVIRGHRFLGLTEQGERVLLWAQRIVADYDGLKQELSGSGAGLSGVLRIGAIPAALPALPPLVNAFCARHPQVRVQIQSMPSAAIQRGLDELEIDAGVTYLDNEPLSRVRTTLLYDESYAFVTCAPWFSGRDTITWAEAADCPLCLLTRDMQNRRIIDQIFAEAGIVSNPRIEVNSFEGVWSIICSGAWGGIVPSSHAEVFGQMEGLQVLPLIDPVRTQPVGLVISDRDPASPVATALMRHAPRREAISVRAPALT